MIPRRGHKGWAPQSIRNGSSLQSAVDVLSRRHRLRRRPPPRFLLLPEQLDYPRGLQAPLLVILLLALGVGPQDEEEDHIQTSGHPPAKHKANVSYSTTFNKVLGG